MARDVVIHCDRCGDLIEAGVSVLAPEAGPLRKRRVTPYDLCESCGRGFVAWLTPELPTLEPTDAPAAWGREIAEQQAEAERRREAERKAKFGGGS